MRSAAAAPKKEAGRKNRFRVSGFSIFFFSQKEKFIKDCGISIALFVDENSNAPSSSEEEEEEEEEACVLCRDGTLFIIIKSIIIWKKSSLSTAAKFRRRRLWPTRRTLRSSYSRRR